MEAWERKFLNLCQTSTAWYISRYLIAQDSTRKELLSSIQWINEGGSDFISDNLAYKVVQVLLSKSLLEVSKNGYAFIQNHKGVRVDSFHDFLKMVSLIL